MKVHVVNDSLPRKPMKPRPGAPIEKFHEWKEALDAWKNDPLIKARRTKSQRWELFVNLAKRKEITIEDVRLYWKTLKKLAFNENFEYEAYIQFQALKEFGNRILGKPKQEIEVNTNQTLTLEQRRHQVLEFLGVGSFGQNQRQSTEAGNSTRQLDFIGSVAALPEPVSDGQKPVHPVGEIPPGGGDVDQRIEVRSETDQPRQAT